MNKTAKRGVAASCLLVLMMNLTACGYFLYPERKGQTGGRVDPTVVILDGAALLFGVLPGVVAFAVDFATGTIYLPAGGRSAVDRHVSAVDTDGAEQVVDQEGQVWLKMPVDKVSLDADNLEQLSATLSSATGQQVAVKDIVWVEDLAALRASMAERTASL
ncbi:hypothetical protein [Microbulbifer yueqingensis]|uniref:Uncharacterized protein n=1 Tax=Microbulbifer yueqingensis TaxID=658219 RepID=A0A1G9AJ29_9GAMM|nr:hypothetical protein [Microbulbifer yueqingensis]SDK27352.1 hypothetical protein SAMN05216212_2039 [Microbulbifer yueqingensis]